MDIGGDAAGLQRGAHAIALLAADHVEMGDVAFAKIPRAFHGEAGQGRRIGGGDLTAARVPAVEVRQFGTQDGGLHLVHAAIAAIFGAPILAGPSVLAERCHPLRKSSVWRGDGAAVAERSQVLGGVEAEAGQRAPTSGLLAADGGAVRLRAILHQGDCRAAGNCQQGRQVRHAPVEMGRDDGAQGRGQAGGQIGGGHIHRAGVDIDVERYGAHRADGGGAVSAGVGHRRHGVARADAQSAQGKFKRVRAIGHRNTMRHAAIRGKLRFERGTLPAQDVPAARQHSIDAGGQFVLKRLGLAQQVVQRDRLRRTCGHGIQL